VQSRRNIASSHSDRHNQPVMTGIEAVQQIRQISELRETVIIAASASVFEKDKENSRIAGCDEFLPKHVSANWLLDMIGTPLNLEWICLVFGVWCLAFGEPYYEKRSAGMIKV